MKITVKRTDFHNAFRSTDLNGFFSYESLDMLFDYFESREKVSGIEIELNAYALCAEYEENTWEDIVDDFSYINLNLSDDDDEEEKIGEVRKFLKRHTTLIGEPAQGIFLYAAF